MTLFPQLQTADQMRQSLEATGQPARFARPGQVDLWLRLDDQHKRIQLATRITGRPPTTPEKILLRHLFMIPNTAEESTEQVNGAAIHKFTWRFEPFYTQPGHWTGSVGDQLSLFGEEPEEPHNYQE
jgi:hypothetical protein